MGIRYIITNLEYIKSAIEWDFPIEWQMVIDEAIKILKEKEKSN